MNKTTVLIVILITVLAASWVALSIGGRQNQTLDQAQPPGNGEPAAPLPNAATPQGGASAKLTRSDKGEGNVNISATFITGEVLEEDPSLTKPDYNPQNEVAFLVAMNTHMVDLAGYKIEEITVLKDAGGNEHKPEGRWQSVQDEAGHHRSGYLKFKRAGAGGKDITQGEGSLTLTVKGVADIARRDLVWELPLPAAEK
ncbi:MAG: hypothetical protein Q8L35_08565 [Actinomycetota bacterium]|nr:hypothetical protein [Actinomycetota bacterium]